MLLSCWWETNDAGAICRPVGAVWPADSRKLCYAAFTALSMRQLVCARLAQQPRSGQTHSAIAARERTEGTCQGVIVRAPLLRRLPCCTPALGCSESRQLIQGLRRRPRVLTHTGSQVLQAQRALLSAHLCPPPTGAGSRTASTRTPMSAPLSIRPHARRAPPGGCTPYFAHPTLPPQQVPPPSLRRRRQHPPLPPPPPQLRPSACTRACGRRPMPSSGTPRCNSRRGRTRRSA